MTDQEGDVRRKDVLFLAVNFAVFWALCVSAYLTFAPPALAILNTIPLFIVHMCCMIFYFAHFSRRVRYISNFFAAGAADFLWSLSSLSIFNALGRYGVGIVVDGEITASGFGVLLTEAAVFAAISTFSLFLALHLRDRCAHGYRRDVNQR